MFILYLFLLFCFPHDSITFRAGEVLPEPKLTILGSTGVGKSTLANVLLGCTPESEDCLFQVCDGVNSCTKETTYGVGEWCGLGEMFTVVDTPGFGDSDNDDNELIDEMIRTLKSTVNSTNIFIIAFNGEQDRLDSSLQQMIRELEALFGKNFWDNVILEFTHWAYDTNSVMKRNQTGKDEKWKLEQMNLALHDMFHINQTLDGVFIDSFSQQPWNIENEFQQIVYQRETAKLWNIMIEAKPFAFQTIEDVLNELSFLREENLRLNRIIEEDLVDLHEILEEVILDTANNAFLISRNDLMIHNVSKSQQEFVELVDIMIEEQNVDLTGLHSKVDGMELSMMPVGSIIAWSGQSLSKTNLPQGWQLCDGSGILTGPMMNTPTPNLNGEGRFLRGGNGFSSWTYQDQMLVNHAHAVNDPGHNHADNGHSHSYTDYGGNSDGYGDNAHDRTHPNLQSTQRTSATSYANLQASTTGIEVGDAMSTNIGSEIRPKNMVVQWIIRIY